MLQRHQNKKISQIWNEENEYRLMVDVWRSHRRNYGPQMRRPPLRDVYGDDKHEVVSNLIRACLEYGDGDLHWGLTSSDVVDAVRIRQCSLSTQVLQERLGVLNTELHKFISGIDGIKVVGYTHLLPAAIMDISGRFLHILEQLEDFQHSDIRFVYKPYAGPVGQKRFQNTLVLDLEEQIYCNQTSNGWTYFTVVCYLAHISAVLHKLAQDCRLMVYKDEMLLASKVSSSSMPHKANPTAMERVCSLALRQSSFIGPVWGAIATSGLERTLTDSAVLRNTLPEAFHNIMMQIEDTISFIPTMKLNIPEVNFNIGRYRDSIMSEVRLEELSKTMPRIDAYMKLREDYGKK